MKLLLTAIYSANHGAITLYAPGKDSQLEILSGISLSGYRKLLSPP
jgi:hypothetical protein